MTEQQQNLQRVFIHELGHLIIKLIAFKHFGIREAERIIFIPRENDFEGRIIPKIPPGVDRYMPTVNYAEKIIDLEYGCFFEAFYYRSSFDNCWNLYGHGNEDLRFWEEEVVKFRAGAKDELVNLRNTHQQEVLNNDILTYIKQLNVKDYLCQDKPFEIDIQKLTEVVFGLFEDHEALILKYIEDVKKVLKDHT